MPIATPEVYAQMLDRAKQQGFAYPAINVTSSQTLNAALRGFAEAESDGIVQISTGGAEYLSGSVKDMVTGAVALAEFAHVVAARYPVNIALHTDHCPKDKLDGYMRPLVAISAERVQRGQEPLFQSHMWDGSAVPLAENLEIATDLLAECAAARIIMEMEIGVVGGEEDGVVGEINEKLYTTPEDALATAEALGLGERGRYILAATFGNVHGVYKPGHVKLRPTVLQGDPGRGGPEVRQGEAVRPGLPRRLGLGAGGDPRGHLLRRGQDERRHRHAVRVHPAGRRPHVHATTTACSRWTATSAARRPTTRAPGARPASRAWPTASSTACEDLLSAGTKLTAELTRMERENLLAGPATPGPRRPAGPPTEAASRAAGRPGARPTVAARFPASSAAWAALAERAFAARARPSRPTPTRRTGYHRGLDQLRRAGWRGNGPMPWEHEPNHGFLRSLHVLGPAAAAIGEDDEAERCAQFLRRAPARPAAAELGDSPGRLS